MRALVFSIDDAYVMPFKVLWHSLMKTDSVPPDAPVFILHEKTLTAPSIQDLTHYIGRNGFSVSFIDASPRVPDDLPVAETDHVSKATFYRLYVASILPEEITSVVYLDSDAVVIRSIRELFEIDLTRPVAAVDHLAPMIALRLWGDKSGNYFQAGVLVIDLDAWRTGDCEVRFAKILSEDRHRISWWDQCVLNLAFEDNWQRLPVWYNVCAQVRRTLEPHVVVEQTRFLHFDGHGKPWRHVSMQNDGLHWYNAYEDAFGMPFDMGAIQRPLWKRLGSTAKRMFRCVLGGLNQ